MQSLDLIERRPLLFLGSRLKRLAERMQTDALRVSDRLGIEAHLGQYPVLVALAETGPETVTALAQRVGSSQPAMSQIVGKLRAAGLVGLARDTRDARQRRVTLTEAGTQLLERARREVWPQVELAVRDAVDGLGGDFLGQIARLEAALADCPLNIRAQEHNLRRLLPVDDTEMDEVAELMNHAYRNIGAARSWTSEETYVAGDRTSASALRAELAEAAPHAVLLAWRHRDTGTLDGCVWLEPLADDRWYLASLAIEPRLQNAGLGRRLLLACEGRLAAEGAREIEITVVNTRETLLAWYARRGYRLTGETRPWPYEDDRYGTPLRRDLCFVVLRKQICC